MVDDGFYVITYQYIDTRGHYRNIRKMRGTFKLILKLYKELIKMKKDGDHKAPIEKPTFWKIKNGIEYKIDFKKELEEWRSLKSNTKK